MPDPSLSDAIREAYAFAPAGVIHYDTLEFRHPAFSTPIRVVRDNRALTARLEADAPQDAGVEVTFVGYAFDFVRPEVGPDGVPQFTIEIDNVSRDIAAHIELALASRQLIEVTYRAYLSTDLDGPSNDPPLTLTLQRITATPFRVSAVASYVNVANKRFPGQDYDAERFPGLIAQ